MSGHCLMRALAQELAMAALGESCDEPFVRDRDERAGRLPPRHLCASSLRLMLGNRPGPDESVC